MTDHGSFTVGWICALVSEHVAAKSFLDEEYAQPEELSTHDNNSYTLGRIKDHKVVIAVLPDEGHGSGTSSAAAVAKDMLHSFPNIRIGLMVGVGGGAPALKRDVRLGDVVVSSPCRGKGGVYQYNFGKLLQNQEFQVEGSLNQPPAALRTAISGLRAQYDADGHQLNEAIETVFKRKPKLRKKYQHPGLDRDRLYNSTCIHPTDNEDGDCETLCGDKTSNNVIPRPERGEDEDNPAIHYGLIASTDHALQDSHLRNELAEKERILCFETEGAAGLMNHFPCLVVRGVWDYSDTHNTRSAWQGYASMTAAAYTRDLLYRIPAKRVEAERKISELLSDVAQNIHTMQGSMANMNSSIQDIVYDQKRHKIESWLSATDLNTKYNSALQERLKGTGEWFLRSTMFEEWRTPEWSFLWLYGISGCGKTILCSTIIQELKTAILPSTNLLYFYFDFNDPRKQTLDSMIRSLINQLYCTCEDARNELENLFSECQDGRYEPDTDSLCTVFFQMTQETEVWIVIDALDECSTRGGQKINENLLLWIRELSNPKHGNIHLLVTSQPLEDIRDSLSNITKNSQMVAIKESLIDHDIRGYIHSRVREGDGLKRWRSHPETQEEIETKIIQKTKGMFRWAACQLTELEKCLDYRTLQKALESLPSTIDETYTRILDAIPRENKDNAIRILQFLAFSKWPLRIQEAVDMIAVDPGESPYFDPKYRMPIPREILYYCSGLVIMTQMRSNPMQEFNSDDYSYGERDDAGHDDDVLVNLRQDSGYAELQLAHLSVKEYLLSTQLSSRIVANNFQTTAVGASMANVFLAYLLHFNYGQKVPHKKLTTLFPLVTYAAKSWVSHAVSALSETGNDSLIRLITEFIFSGEESLQICYRLDTVADDLGYEDYYPPSALYYMAYGGLIPAVKLLLDKGVDVNAVGGPHGSALQAAVHNGYEQIVELLLAKGADVTSPDTQFYSPLNIASKGGHERIVHMLLDHGAEVTKGSGYLADPLYGAVSQGHERIVEILLENGGEVTSMTLYEAALGGYNQIVRRLLVECDQADDGNSERLQDALYAASSNGYYEIAKMLVEKGANVNGININIEGLTGNALIAASRSGSAQIVQLLLEAGADVNGQDPFMTALQAAAHKGHDQIVKMLLDKGASASAGGMCESMLYIASRRGYKQIVQLLLEAGAEVDGVKLETSFQVAAYKGHIEIVAMLLDHGADVHAMGKYSSPLYAASVFEDREIVQLLLDKGVDINAKGGQWGTALQAAAFFGHNQMVRLLLDRGADPNSMDGAFAYTNHESTDESVWTPLNIASRHGYVDVVKLLLERGADVSLRSKGGWMPLNTASAYGRTEVVELLLEKGAGTTAANDDGWGPLHTAARYGYHDVVELLLKKGANVNTTGARGWTALNVASYYGNPKVVRALIEAGADIEISNDVYGWKPVDVALSQGCLGALKQLKLKVLMSTKVSN